MRLAAPKGKLAAKTTNRRVATNHAEDDVEDAKSRLLRAMSTIALPAAGHVPEAVPKTRHKSRFFFVPDADQLEIARRKKQVEGSRRKATIEDTTGKRASAYKIELEPVVQSNVDSVREFFLNEINPLLLAASLGAAQALEVTQTTLEASVDPGPYSYFEGMLRKAAQAKLDKFVAEYIGIHMDELYGKVDKPQSVNSPRSNERNQPERRERSGRTLSRTVQ